MGLLNIIEKFSSPPAPPEGTPHSPIESARTTLEQAKGTLTERFKNQLRDLKKEPVTASTLALLFMATSAILDFKGGRYLLNIAKGKDTQEILRILAGITLSLQAIAYAIPFPFSLFTPIPTPGAIIRALTAAPLSWRYSPDGENSKSPGPLDRIISGMLLSYLPYVGNYFLAHLWLNPQILEEWNAGRILTLGKRMFGIAKSHWRNPGRLKQELHREVDPLISSLKATNSTANEVHPPSSDTAETKWKPHSNPFVHLKVFTGWLASGLHRRGNKPPFHFTLQLPKEVTIPPNPKIKVRQVATNSIADQLRLALVERVYTESGFLPETNGKLRQDPWRTTAQNFVAYTSITLKESGEKRTYRLPVGSARVLSPLPPNQADKAIAHVLDSMSLPEGQKPRIEQLKNIIAKYKLPLLPSVIAWAAQHHKPLENPDRLTPTLIKELTLLQRASWEWSQVVAIRVQTSSNGHLKTPSRALLSRLVKKALTPGDILRMLVHASLTKISANTEEFAPWGTDPYNLTGEGAKSSRKPRKESRLYPDGLTPLRKIISRFPKAPVIIFTTDTPWFAKYAENLLGNHQDAIRRLEPVAYMPASFDDNIMDPPPIFVIDTGIAVCALPQVLKSVLKPTGSKKNKHRG